MWTREHLVVVSGSVFFLNFDAGICFHLSTNILVRSDADVRQYDLACS